MKTKLFISFLFALFSLQAIHAQSISFCSDYSSSGDCIGSSSSWTIEPGGGSVYILYKNGGKNITASKLWVYIDILRKGSYSPVETKELVPDKYKNWMLYDYKFTEAGEYKVQFLDASNTLATAYVTISMKGSTTSSSSSSGGSGGGSGSGVDTWYYEGSTVQFCEDVTSSGSAVTPSEVFNISSSGGYVYVLLKHTKQFKTNKIYVDIYKGSDTEDVYETKEYDVEDDWKWFKFKYTFYSTGNYTFKFYNEDDTYIQSGYVDINWK
ncbi:MAG: hypothetical protein SFW35_14305 [Chitinophagales bacterium]|nr:hypothetical protein [Chitinophagales bacterium]